MMEPITIMMLGVAGAVAGLSAMKPTKQPGRVVSIRRKPAPVAKPAPIKPATARLYGAQRGLIAKQRAWMEAEGVQPPVEHQTAQTNAASEAFANWFYDRIEIPTAATMADVITHTDWASDYHKYCDDNGLPRLFDADLLAHAVAYARENDCSIGANGELLGGRFVKA